MMKLRNRIISLLAGAAVAFQATGMIPVSAAGVAPTLIAKDDYDYAEGTDLSTITGADEFWKYGYSEAVDLTSASDYEQFKLKEGTAVVTAESEPEFTKSVSLIKPAANFGRTFETPIDYSVKGQIYYVSWYQYFDGTMEQTSDIFDKTDGFRADFGGNVMGAGFKNIGGNINPYVSWTGTNRNAGTRSMQTGKWYRMVVRLEAATNNVVSVKAYPKDEYPHPDWDATLTQASTKTWNGIRFATGKTSEDAVKKVADFKVEQFKKEDAASAKAAENAATAAYDAVTNRAADMDARIQAAKDAISALAPCALQDMLAREIEGLEEYKELIIDIAAMKEACTYDLYTSVMDRLSAISDTLRYQDLSVGLDQYEPIADAEKLVCDAERTASDADIAAAQSAVDGLTNAAQKALLQERIDSLSLLKPSISAVSKAEESKLLADFQAAEELIGQMLDGDAKTGLLARLATLLGQIAPTYAPELTAAAETAVTTSAYEYALRFANALPSGSDKTELLARLSALKTTIDGMVPTISGLKITGSTALGGKLAPSYQTVDTAGNAGTFQVKWYRGDAQSGTLIGSDETYTIMADDPNSIITVSVTPSNNAGKTGEAVTASKKISKSPVIAQDSFDYPAGTKAKDIPALSGANEPAGFTSGWNPKKDLTGTLTDDHYIDGEGLLHFPKTAGGGIYRQLKTPINLGSDSEYYLHFTAKIAGDAWVTGSHSSKVELIANDTTIYNFGVIGNSTLTALVPFYKDAAVKKVESVPIPKETLFHMVIRLSTTAAGPNKTYFKTYLDGEEEPENWQLETTYSNNSVIDRISYYSNNTNASTHTFGPVTIEHYAAADIAEITAAGNAVNEAVRLRTQASVDAANELLNLMTDGLAKNALLAQLRGVVEELEHQKELEAHLAGEMTALENTEISDSNYQQIYARVEQAKQDIAELKDETLKAGFQQRLESVEYRMNIVKITAERATEDFSYPAGTLLSSTTAEGQFQSGWKADADVTQALGDDYVITASGAFSRSGSTSMFRKFKSAIHLKTKTESISGVTTETPENETYLNWQFTASDLTGFAGIGLKHQKFGVIPAEGGFKATMTADGRQYTAPELFSAGTSYNAVLKMTAMEISFTIYPEGSTPNGWLLTTDRAAKAAAAQEPDLYTTIEVAAEGTFSLLRLVREDALASFTQPAQEAAAKALETTKTSDIRSAQQEIEKLPECIVRTFTSGCVDRAMSINREIIPAVDYVTIEGSASKGSRLTGKFAIIDRVENSDTPVIEWFSNGNRVSSSDTYTVSSSDAGRTITFSVTPKNIYGKSAEAQTYSLKIPSDNGSGGGGGGGGGGTGRFPGVPAVVPTPTVPTNNDYTPPEEAAAFADISGHWAQSEIETLYNLGIVNGAQKDFFCPDDNVTRAQFAAMLSRVLRKSGSIANAGFSDVSETDWCYEDVNNIAALGIMVGSADGAFHPDQLITREEMAKAIATAFEVYGGDGARGEVSGFSDQNDISVWAVPYVETCVSLRLMQGVDGGRFAPKEYATRAQAAVVIGHLLNSK